MMSSYLLAMGFGILGSIQLHLAKCLQLQGISTVGSLKRIYGVKKNIKTKGSTRNIYLLGIFLSNSGFFWILLANKYGPSSLFTSMFGTGLIFLMFYSQKILKENVNNITYFSALILTIGTILVGISSLNQNHLDMTLINAKLVFVLAIGFIILSAIIFLIYHHSTNPRTISTVFGFIAGGMASFDPILKGIGQNYHQASGLIPSHPKGWSIFMSSLFFSTLAFGVTQLGFYKKARATTFVPVFNSVYIIFPLLLQTFALPGFSFNWLMILGLILLITGLVGMRQINKYV